MSRISNNLSRLNVMIENFDKVARSNFYIERFNKARRTQMLEAFVPVRELLNNIIEELQKPQGKKSTPKLENQLDLFGHLTHPDPLTGVLTIDVLTDNMEYYPDNNEYIINGVTVPDWAVGDRIRPEGLEDDNTARVSISRIFLDTTKEDICNLLKAAVPYAQM